MFCPEVGDVCERNPVTANSEEVFYEVTKRMKATTCVRCPLYRRMASSWIAHSARSFESCVRGDSDPLKSRQVISSVTKICNVIKGKNLHSVDPDATSEMIVMVGAMSAEGFY